MRRFAIALLFGLLCASLCQAKVEVVFHKSSTRFIRPAESADLLFSVENKGEQAEPFSGRVTCEIVDFWGKSWHSETLEMSLGADALNVFERQVKLTDPGYYQVNFSIAKTGGDTIQIPAAWSVAVCQLDEQPANPLLGTYLIGNHWMLRDLVPDGYFRDMAAIGVTWGTMDTWWPLLEPEKGVYNWESYDHWFQAALDAGITPIPHLFGIPAWNTTWEAGKPGDSHTYPPRDLEAWGRFVHDFVDRYKGWIKYLRIWNEPNTGYWRGTAADYAKLVSVASKAAKSAKPDIQIMIEAADNPHYDAVKFLEEVAQTLPSSAWDVVGIHNYWLNNTSPPETTTFTQRYTAFNAWRQRNNPKAEAWDTEFACMADDWGTEWKGVGEEHQAQWLVRSHAIGFAEGLDRMIWFPGYSWPDPTTAPHYNPAGLLRVDMTPRPACVAFQVMARELQGAKFHQSIDLGPDAFGKIFELADGYVTLLWSAGEPRTVAVEPEPDGGGMQIVDLMGRATELKSNGHAEIELTLDHNTKYLHTKAKPVVRIESH